MKSPLSGFKWLKNPLNNLRRFTFILQECFGRKSWCVCVCVCVCVCRHTSVFEGYVIVLDPTAGCSLWLEVLVEPAAEEPRCLQPRLWKHKYNIVKPMRSLQWVPLTTSSVETSTPLQRAGFFASKSLTAMLKVRLQRAPTYNNKQLLLHLFTRCKRDPVCTEGSFGHASGYCPLYWMWRSDCWRLTDILHAFKGRSTLAREPVVEAGVSCSNQIQENHEILQ